MAITRIKLVSPDYQDLEAVCNLILEIAKRAGVKVKGPVPLPTKKLSVSVRKSPCGGGTETFETREMRLHKRLIDVQADDTALSKIMRIPVPSNVNFSMEMKA